MQIRRIEIRDFRKLSHVVVEDLQDGLNILVGDNEAGKSTLLAALRAGLFERHRVGGDVAAGMLPYGQSVRPEISIDFDLNGKHWRLKKAFCQRPEAELVGPGERAIGDAVEDRLAELFGFTPPGKGRSKPEEHQGIYGLLWVEQGGSYRSLGVGAGRPLLSSKSVRWLEGNGVARFSPPRTIGAMDSGTSATTPRVHTRLCWTRSPVWKRDGPSLLLPLPRMTRRLPSWP